MREPSEPTDPFELLGLARGASEQALRAAFRAAALLHHPDRNRGDAGAAERFKRVARAYREAVRWARGEPSRPRRPAEPPPGRWACPCCGDRFVACSPCPRCDVALHDGLSGAHAVPNADARVDAWEAELERRAERRWPRVDAASKWAPAAIAVSFVLAGALVAKIGPLAPAIMFASFGAWVAIAEAHARWRGLLLASS